MPNQLSPATFAIQVFKILGLLKNRGLGYFVKTLVTYMKQRTHGNCGSCRISNERYTNWIKIHEQNQISIDHVIDAISKKPKLIVFILTNNETIRGLDRTVQSLNDQIYNEFDVVFACDDNFPMVHEAPKKYNLNAKGLFWIVEDRDLMASFKAFFEKLAYDLAIFINASDVFSRFALLEVSLILAQWPHVKYVYSDEDSIDDNGVRTSPFFKPDWSPDLLMSFPYTGNLSAFEWERLVQVCTKTVKGDPFDLYDLTLRFTEDLQEHEIFHVPKILVHRHSKATVVHEQLLSMYARRSELHRPILVETLARRGIQGDVVDGCQRGTFRVRRKLTGNPPVSIIIPTRNRLSLLRNCIKSIESRTTYRNYEILVVDNLSSDSMLLEYLQSFGHRVVRYEEPFNFSRLNNFAVRFARGEVLLFLNNDVEVITADWIESMLEHGLRQEVGAVGCKLLYPNGSIQHAGIVLGMDLDDSTAVAGHVFKRLKPGESGYFGLAHVVRNVSAVTAAAMMTRKAVFEAMGGFDEDLGVSFNDVDFCLRVRQAGYLVVYTPYAELYHHESATRPPGASPVETLAMFEKWDGVLHRDPYYNPNLSLRSFMCDIAL